jgi:cell shape-determining protein MreC
LFFDEKHIFNFNSNHSANGIIQHQEINEAKGWEKLVEQLKEENKYLKSMLERLTD